MFVCVSLPALLLAGAAAPARSPSVFGGAEPGRLESSRLKSALQKVGARVENGVRMGLEGGALRRVDQANSWRRSARRQIESEPR